MRPSLVSATEPHEAGSVPAVSALTRPHEMVQPCGRVSRRLLLLFPDYVAVLQVVYMRWSRSQPVQVDGTVAGSFACVGLPSSLSLPLDGVMLLANPSRTVGGADRTRQTAGPGRSDAVGASSGRDSGHGSDRRGGPV
jgi:hypothetical protein